MLQEQTSRFFNDILRTDSQFKTRAFDCNVPVRDQLNLQPVIESYPLHKHRKVVITIITLRKDMQTKIDLGRR